MAKPIFIDFNPPVIDAAFLNSVGTAIWNAIGDGTNPPTTPAEVRANLGIPLVFGDVTGPASSTTNNIATFADLTGKVIKDSGILATSVVVGPSTATNNFVPLWDLTTGKLLKDSTINGAWFNQSVTTTATPTFGATTITALVNISGASAGQIQFPATQNASANANTLDDYEEGTFNFTIISSGGGTPVYTGQNGFYTKIGNRVYFNGRVSLSSLGTLAAGTVSIGGLPFSVANIANNFGVINVAGTSLAAGVTSPVTGATILNTNTVNILTFATGALTNMTVSQLTNTSEFYFGGNYMTV